MRRLRVTTILTVSTLTAVLAAAAAVGVAGHTLLRDLGDEQAIARARLAAEGAAAAIERSADRLLTSSLLLAERPTLARLLGEESTAELAAFLEAFRGTSGITAAAVLDGERILATAGAALSWSELLAPAVGSPAGGSAPPARRTLSDPGGGRPLVQLAWAPVREGGEAWVATAMLLDAEYEAGIANRVGLPIVIFGRRGAEDAPDRPRGAVRFRAMLEDRTAAEPQRDRQRYLAAAPLRDRRGEVVGAVEALLAATIVDSGLARFAGSLLLLTLVVGAVAGLLAVAAARRAAAPLARLTEAALRIGGGDLDAPVPPGGGGSEIATLSEAMEEMRRRLLRLTGELARERHEARAVVDGIVEGVFAVDRERRIRFVNQQGAALLGLPAEQIVGRFCGDVLNPQGPGGVRPCATSCPIVQARFGGSARATEHLVLAGGRRRTVVITAAAPDAAGEPDLRQFQVLRDETEVEAVRRLRDAVLADISHEFKSPLAAQLASIELLLDRLPDLAPLELAELVQALQRGTLRLNRLVDNLLESSRIEAGREALRSQRVELDQVVEEAAETMRPLLAQRHQELVAELPFPLPAVIGDEPRLIQVFVNLLANANKFAPAGTVIRIDGAVEGERVRLWIEDEGPGVPEGAAGALFERYVRAPAAEPEQGGIGLGLWIVQSIVRRHGGEVEVARGRVGARVVVTLPTAGAAAREQPGIPGDRANGGIE